MYTFAVERLRDITAVDVDYAGSLMMKMDERWGMIEKNDGSLQVWFEQESPFKSKLLRRRKECIRN